MEKGKENQSMEVERKMFDIMCSYQKWSLNIDFALLHCNGTTEEWQSTHKHTQTTKHTFHIHREEQGLSLPF